MTIGERIKYLRNKSKMSQEDLALHLNVSRQALQKRETNKSEPSLETIKEIAKFFDVTSSYLLGEEKISKNSCYTKLNLRQIISLICFSVSNVGIILLLVYAINNPRYKDGIYSSNLRFKPSFPVESSELIFLILFSVFIISMIVSIIFFFVNFKSVFKKIKKDEEE